MSKVALIPPISKIEHYCTGRPIQMALAHLVDKVAAYRNAYRRLAADSYVVLDNGAWEVVQSYPINRLWDLAESIHAQEIVLPDVLLCSDETIQASEKAIQKIKQAGVKQFKYAFVLQGCNLKEYHSCLKWALLQPEISTIMIPKLAEPRVPNGRAGLLTWFRSNSPILYKRLYDKRIHLLGIWHNPLEIYNCTVAHPKLISSVDSALPFHMAYGRRVFDTTFGLDGFEKTKRPEGYFEYIESEEDTGLSEYNIEVLDLIAQESKV